MPPVTTMKPDHTVILLLIEHFNLSYGSVVYSTAELSRVSGEWFTFLNVGLISINYVSFLSYYCVLRSACHEMQIEKKVL